MSLPAYYAHDGLSKSLGACRVGRSGKILDANDQFCQLVNYSQSEIQQLPIATVLFFSPCDLPPSWRTGQMRCQEAHLIDRNGHVRHVRVMGLLNVAAAGITVPKEEQSRVLVVYEAAGAGTEGTNGNDPQVNLNQAIYGIHSASSAAEIIQATSDWCRSLLPQYVGIGMYDHQGSWSWAYHIQGVDQAIGDRLGAFDTNQLLSSLQTGGWVRLPTGSAASASAGPSRCLSYDPSYESQKENGREGPVALSAALRIASAAEGFEALLVPIEYQGSVLGALVLSPTPEGGDHGDEDRYSAQPTALSASALTPTDLELATTLAKHAALAIAKAPHQKALQNPSQTLTPWVEHQIQHLQQALNFEAAIKRITENIRDSLDERHIFETVMRELCETLVLDCCTVGFYDLHQQTVDVRYSHTTTTNVCLIQGSIMVTSDNAEVYGLLLQGLSIQHSPLHSSSDRRMVPYSTTLAYPMTMNQQIIGDLWLCRPKYSLFNQQEIRLVEQIVNQCAIGLRQARLYQQAQAQVKSLETLGDLKDDFLNTVSHELRTPVTNIKMTAKMLELALHTQHVTDTRISRYIKILHAEAQREMDLINDLLDLQRLDAGMQSLDLKPIEIASWLNQLFDGFRERAVDNQQQLHVNIVADVTLFTSDENSLKRMVAELVNNACKYTPPQESITIEGRVGPAELTLSVCNSGIEVPESEQGRIFEKFYRINSSDRRKQGGTGLGLALVKQLAQSLRGDVRLTSKNGLTCFTLTLPQLDRPVPEATSSP